MRVRSRSRRRRASNLGAMASDGAGDGDDERRRTGSFSAKRNSGAGSGAVFKRSGLVRGESQVVDENEEQAGAGTVEGEIKDTRDKGKRNV